MKIKEKLAEWLEQTEVFDIAYFHKKAKNIVESHARSLSMNVIKILIIPRSPYIDCWKHEINVSLFDMETIRLMPPKKRLSYEEYKAWLIDDQPRLDVSNLIDDIQRQYPSEFIVLTEKTSSDFQDILLSMCHDLANYTAKNASDYFENVK